MRLRAARRSAYRSALPAAALLAALGIVGCKSGNSSSGTGGASGPASQVTVTLTSDGCAPQPASVPAGPVKFTITNNGASGVSEAELKQGGHILGEKENVTPGLSGSFTVRLGSGSYELACPGAKQSSWPFTVSAGATATPASRALTPATAIKTAS